MRRAALLAVPVLTLACRGEPTSTSAPSASSTASPPRITNPSPSPASSSQPAAASATATPSAPPSASASAAPTTSAAATSAPPTDDEWQSAPDVRVAGSTALGCDTKRVREWVRVSCTKPNDTQGTPVSMKLEKAEIIRKGEPIVQIRREVKVGSEAGKTTLVTRYVEGTDVEATFAWSDKEKHLSLFWPSGKPEPLYAGGFK